MKGSWAAKELQFNQRPVSGWEAVDLPDAWQQRWPGWVGNVWYRVDWHIACPEQHWGLAISAMRRAGTVYWGDELLWTDRHLTAPYSRSGNVPRWWPLSTQDRPGLQTVWVRVVGDSYLTPGLGDVELDNAQTIRDSVEGRMFRQQTGYLINAAMSAAIGCVAFFVWLWRRAESTYLWFAGMQWLWTLYLATMLRTEPVLAFTGLGLTGVTLFSFLLYAQCFWMFSLRFMGLTFPYLEKICWAVVFIWLLLVGNLSFDGADVAVDALFYWSSVLVHGSCLLVIVQALRTRERPHLWLALCWLGILFVAMHDIVVALRTWSNHETWAALFGPASALFLAGLLGWQLATSLRRVDRFNTELKQHVEDARTALAQMLAQQHAKALEHAKLQVRVHLAHDLHDGLGGSLVRSMALVEQAAPQLQRDKVLSMLKVLRDDLRQVIDVGSSAEVAVPDTPVLWLAPLRHRFTLILDELGLSARWQVDASWRQPPSSLQCMAMARFLEEAFANVLKHSRAGSVCVQCLQPGENLWRVILQDDGVGFDVAAVQGAGMGIGMQSMQSRLARVGGALQVQSGPQGTTLTAEIPIVPHLQ